jgi:hypothetical protein
MSTLLSKANEIKIERVPETGVVFNSSETMLITQTYFDLAVNKFGKTFKPNILVTISTTSCS